MIFIHNQGMVLGQLSSLEPARSQERSQAATLCFYTHITMFVNVEDSHTVLGILQNAIQTVSPTTIDPSAVTPLSVDIIRECIQIRRAFELNLQLKLTVLPPQPAHPS